MCSFACLEVQPQRELNLPIGADADLVGHRGGQDAEIAARGRRREGDAGLQSRGAGPGRQARGQPQIAGVGEVRVIEDVVELGAELHVLRLPPTRNFLLSVISNCCSPGPVRLLRAELPKEPAAGIENAAGFSQFSPFCRYGSTPATTSGRRTLRLLPPPSVLTTGTVTTAPLTTTGLA